MNRKRLERTLGTNKDLPCRKRLWVQYSIPTAAHTHGVTKPNGANGPGGEFDLICLVLDRVNSLVHAMKCVSQRRDIAFAKL